MDLVALPPNPSNKRSGAGDAAARYCLELAIKRPAHVAYRPA